MTYNVVRKCDDGTLVLRPDLKASVQKGTPLFLRMQKVGAIIETIGRVDCPLVVGQVAKKFADEKQFE